MNALVNANYNGIYYAFQRCDEDDDTTYFCHFLFVLKSTDNRKQDE